MCVKVFLVLVLVLDSMTPTRSWRSASHDAGSHDRLPKKTGGSSLRRGRIRWIQFAQSLLTVAHQQCAGCIRLVHWCSVVVVVEQPLLRVAVEGSDNPVSLEKPCQGHSIGRETTRGPVCCLRYIGVCS